jgi:NTP pyrophosphatase (non-canonical NTP hydrolase)
MRMLEFQALLKKLYLHKDQNRGIKSTFMWLIEEIGELATLLNAQELDKVKISEELADVIAWTISIANILNIDIEKSIVSKYPNKCIKCNSSPCNCVK